MFLKPAENFEHSFLLKNGTYVIVLLAENELAAAEFQTPISTKGSEGKKFNMYFHCMHRKTDKEEPRQGC